MKKILIIFSLILFVGLQTNSKNFSNFGKSDSTFSLPEEIFVDTTSLSEENKIFLLRNLNIVINTKGQEVQILQDSLRSIDSLILEAGRASSVFSPELTRSFVTKEVLRDSLNEITLELKSLELKKSNLKK